MGGFAVQSALRPSSQPSLSPSHLQVCLFFICMHWLLLVPWLLIGIPSTASFWGPGTAQAAPASRDLKTAMALSTECFQTFRMLALLGKAGRCLALHCVFSVFSENQINFSLEESWLATSLLWFSSRPSSIWVPEGLRAPKLKCDRVGLLEYFGDSLSVHFNGSQPVRRELFGVSCIFTWWSKILVILWQWNNFMVEGSPNLEELYYRVIALVMLRTVVLTDPLKGFRTRCCHCVLFL